MKNKKLAAVRLFSGCGGLDLGCHFAGIPVLVSLDFDKDSTETLKLNKEFKNTHIIHEDIRNFSSEKFEEMIKKANISFFFFATFSYFFRKKKKPKGNKSIQHSFSILNHLIFNIIFLYFTFVCIAQKKIVSRKESERRLTIKPF